MSGYSDFARFYDLLQSDIDYKAIADYYDKIIQNFGGGRGLTLDLACGTGQITRLFSNLGYDMIGVDISPDMLCIASSISSDKINYLCQDMTELDMYGTLDNVICTLDGINHLDNLNDVVKTFEKIYLFLNHGGLFVFDINTIYKHKYILGNNTFVYDMDDLYTVWQNFYLGNGKVDIELDFFEKKNSCYKRYTDSFSEIAFEIPTICNKLHDIGFEILGCFDWLNFEKYNSESEKAVIIAKR